MLDNGETVIHTENMKGDDMSTHTPGPWTVHNSPTGIDVTVTAFTPINHNPISVARVYGPGPLSRATDTRNANARLIAAAPDLLHQLKEVVFAYHDESKTSLEIRMQAALEGVAVAIAKAEGE